MWKERQENGRQCSHQPLVCLLFGKCVCVCVRVCVQVCVCTCMYVCVPVCMHMFVFVFVCAHVYVGVFIFVYAYKCACNYKPSQSAQEGDIAQANKHAETAMEHDKYNPHGK